MPEVEFSFKCVNVQVPRKIAIVGTKKPVLICISVFLYLELELASSPARGPFSRFVHTRTIGAERGRLELCRPRSLAFLGGLGSRRARVERVLLLPPHHDVRLPRRHDCEHRRRLRPRLRRQRDRAPLEAEGPPKDYEVADPGGEMGAGDLAVHRGPRGDGDRRPAYRGTPLARGSGCTAGSPQPWSPSIRSIRGHLLGPTAPWPQRSPSSAQSERHSVSCHTKVLRQLGQRFPRGI